MRGIDFVAAPRIRPNGARNAIPAGFYHGLLNSDENSTPSVRLSINDIASVRPFGLANHYNPWQPMPEPGKVARVPCENGLQRCQAKS